MTPTETLKHEHQIILLVLTGAEREVTQIGETGRVSAETVGEMVDLFRNFVDRCHHAKEERHLFPRMQERGIPREGGPIEVMLHEHDLGRAHVRAMAEALPQAAEGDAEAAATVAEHLGGYAELLRAHIDKENTILFVIADQVLTAEYQRELEEAFERLEAEEIGAGVHEKYHQLAHRLAEG